MRLQESRAGPLFRWIAAAALLVGWATSGGSAGTAGQAVTDREVREALASAAYAAAVDLGTALVAHVQAIDGAESIESAEASDVLIEALTKAGRVADDSTVARAEQVVRLKEQLLGADHIRLAVSLDNLGAVRTERGEFALAIPLHERAVAIRSRAAAGDPAIADSLDRLALPLIRLQRFEEARRALDRSMSLREPLAGAAPRALAQTLELVALLNRYAGKYTDAAAPLERALALRRDLGLDNHPDNVSILSLRGDLLYLGGDIRGAQRIWGDAVSLAERTLGREHPAAAPLLRRLAAAAEVLGDKATERQLLDRALQVGTASLAPCHPEIAGTLNDLATSMAYFGSYAEARQLYDRALTIRQRCLGPNHSLTATIIFNTADLSARTGDFGEAERLYRSAIRVWSETLGPRHPYVALGLDALAQALMSRRLPGRARALYEQALTIRKKALGEEHPDVAWTMTNLARAIADLGQTRLALAEVGQAIKIYQRAGASVEPDHLARMLRLRGELEMKQRRYDTARATFAEEVATRERVFGAAHPLSAEARADLAAAHFALGSYQAALDDALSAEQTARDHLRFTVRYLPERQGLLYAAHRPRGLDLALSIAAAGHPDAASRILDTVIRSRAIVLDEVANRTASAAADPAVASLQQAAAAARQRFANLMLRSLMGGEAVPRSLLDEARAGKENAERALAEQSDADRAKQSRARVGLNDLHRALPAGSALVSFVRYERAFPPRAGNAAAPPTAAAPAYMALVMRADAPAPEAIPLGSAAAIDGLVRAWRTEVLKGPVAVEPVMQSYRTAGAALRRRIWDPIARRLDGVTGVFIVPDGSISVVAFDALPLGTNQYLVEAGRPVHYLSAERDLVDLGEPSRRGAGLLAVGGVAFEAASGPAASATTRSACDVRNLRFDPLPGTRKEVAEVAGIWKASASASEDAASVLEGRDASESRFKAEASGRRVVHIATHGFFLGSDCGRAAAGARSVGGLIKAPASPIDTSADNPLMLSGLAMAGANRRAARAGDDDGILTAEEVTGLDLRGVEWAVLSACDTGLGEVKAGEGVLGLRRAFQIAGTRTIIMSMWPVDDEAVRAWMRALYEGRLQRRLSTADAVQQASLDVLRHRRARGSSTHPFYWAGFVAAGDWR